MSQDKTKVQISVCLIASNEEANMEDCLESVRDIASEIILVHNDCRDDTVKIAERYGARCFEEKWHGHRNQKNIALGKATKPWVLCIDADERLSPALLASIKALLNDPDSMGSDGYAFNRRSFFLGRWIRYGDWYPDRKLRLAKRGLAIWKGSREHDKLQIEGRTERLKGDLLHYSYPSMNSFVTKIIYFSDIFLQRQLDADAKWKLSGVLLRPVWRFIRGYFIRLGFLDGFPGLFISVSTAFATFFRHSRLYESENVAQPVDEQVNQPSSRDS